MEKITSIDNSYIKKIRKLKQKKYRDKEKLFLVESPHIIKEAYDNNLLDCLITTKSILPNINCKLVDENVIKTLTSFDTPPTEVGVVKYLKEKELGNKILILDDIQDPGNLGTIIRSCVAFNIDTVVLSKNTVDVYNPKVINATQGMIFKINIIKRDIEEFIKYLKENNYIIYGTDVINGIDVRNISKLKKEAIIMGNEGNGISNNIKKLVDKNIYIKMNKDCESLNVGVATSIILYEFDRRNNEVCR